MKRAVVAGWVACVAVASSVGACSAARGQPDVDASGPPMTGPGERDAATEDARDLTPPQPRLVLVNGLIDGGKNGVDNVRVCIEGVDYPLPDAVPMPMTNYPGIARGTGMDLGVMGSAKVTLRVFRAVDLQSDAAWSTRVSCASWPFKASNTTLTLDLLAGPNVGVLVDDPAGTDGIGARIGRLPAEYAGKNDTLQMVAAEFSTFAKAGETLRVSVDGHALGSGASGVLSPAPYGFSTLGMPLASSQILFERVDGASTVTASFAQSLGSVQFLADPTTTPAGYFDQRTNYAFVLLGDAKTPVATDEKNLQFNGKGLHVVAVPYVAVAP